MSVDLGKDGVEGAEVARERSEGSSVADVADMGVWSGDGEVGGVVLAGIGMEMWRDWGGGGRGGEEVGKRG